MALLDAILRGEPERGARRVEAALARHPLATMDPLDRPYGQLAYAFAVVGRPDRTRALHADSAIAMYERYVYERYVAARYASRAFGPVISVPDLGDAPHLAPTLRRLGELYEERGDRERATRCYGRFVESWKGADPELQPQVAEVRGRLARLRGDPPG